MIVELDICKEEVAKSVLNIQIPAYRVEAELINFDGIPQLNDTVQSLIESEETFIGFVTEGQLQGVLSYSDCEDHMQICRLVVHPEYFRKGIASQMLKYFLSEVALEGKKVIVSTGAKNTPAKALYKKYDFQEVKDIEVAVGVSITLLQKNKEIKAR